MQQVRDRTVRAPVADGAGSAAGADLSPTTLRFRHPELERDFENQYFRQNLANLRLAHLMGIGLWVIGWLVYRGYLLPSDQSVDSAFRYAVFIPILLIGLAVSYTKAYPRMWEQVVAVELLVTMAAWEFYVVAMRTMPPDFGYVGIILISAFTYTLARLRFVYVVLVATSSVAIYVPYAVVADQIFGVRTVLATFYLLTFSGLGGIAAYRLERSTRLLFLRERELAQEHQRSESLLLNILPQEIIDRLKVQENGARLAEALDDVSVLFADAVGFTEQAAKTPPDQLVEALDDLFRRFDVLSDRFGLEKIKTVGDAYMAVAGAPVPKPDHASAAAEMALAIMGEVEGAHWPSGEPIVMRIGVASGPAVAGVIGQRKFAYDLWGDTVNLASRLEAYGEPGRILVSEDVADRLRDDFEFGPPQVVDLKGKGPTGVRFLLGRSRP